jgi:opacity protein-like surface antigen
VIGADLVVPLYNFKGSAVDTVYFPGLAKYEADPKFSLMVSAHLGRALGKALPYLFGAAGFVTIDGRTLNIDLSDKYSPGFVQSAVATHLIWQGGAGLDYQVSDKLFAGARIAAFTGARADHTMPWNEPGPNMFGYHSALFQINLGFRF